MQEKHSSTLKVMNIITAVGLVLFTLFVVLWFYDTSPSIVWDGLRSGILEINGQEAALPAIFCFFPLGIWCLIPLVLSLIAYGRKKPSAKKSTILWASILLGGITVMIIGLFAVQALCVPETLSGNNDECRLPVRPGVVVPTPV